LDRIYGYQDLFLHIKVPRHRVGPMDIDVEGQEEANEGDLA
jgi:hypothetical protein